MAVILLLFTIVAPLGLIAWTVRVLRTWRGRWRYAAIPPLLMVVGAVPISINGIRHDPMGHGGWPAGVLGLLMIAALSAYLLSEIFHARQRRKVGR
jgi:hypothetical protein